MTMEAWMMKRTRGSLGLNLEGLRPSKIPACGGATGPVAVGWADEAVADMFEPWGSMTLEIKERELKHC